MKSYIIILLMIFVALQTAVAQGNPQPAGCSITDGCLTYKLNGATQHDDDTYILSYTITVNCATRLEYIAFQLPEGADADEPSSYFASQNDFNVQDGKKGGDKIETSYNAIQFTAKNQTNISNGASYTFEYPISVTNYNALSNIQVQAKVEGASPSQISFDHKTCAPLAATPGPRPMPDCRVDLGTAVFGFLEATENGDGTTTVSFMVQNNMAEDVESFAIEVPGAPETVTAVTDNNGGAYHLNYKFKATYEAGIMTFSAQNTKDYADGAMEVFIINMPSDAYAANQDFTLSLAAGGTTVTTGLNTVTCEDGGITPLPVELLSFEGKATQSGIELEWETASESNNDHFEIERSSDGKNFASIGIVDGAGNSNTKRSYNYLDDVNYNGMYYYRLRQVDFDGEKTFSNVIAVQLKATPDSGQMAVYPNPAPGNIITVSVSGTGADINGGTLQIVDMSGKVRHAYQVAAGSRKVEVSLPELRLQKGMYFVNLLQGNSKQTQKLIVQ
ncbi:T9SS type A sorting domain-containing protein [Pontibacter sp. KCTC 32443]|uniref:T9SS type A sorting domain-containing protein n=1 Tax=Pontibacter TaxID=323449 RepID=UPI00164DE094|nr:MULTISPECIES: T9SS type A sorting domain-containing protein [Pontibacter]MBC5773955.1 T9SS type A sorting domain-containing protein [Pontibacter sp. KCTC 32443]